MKKQIARPTVNDAKKVVNRVVPKAMSVALLKAGFVFAKTEQSGKYHGYVSAAARRAVLITVGPKGDAVWSLASPDGSVTKWRRCLVSQQHYQGIRCTQTPLNEVVIVGQCRVPQRKGAPSIIVSAPVLSCLASNALILERP